MAKVRARSTLPVPSDEVELAVASPDALKLRAVSKAVAVAAFPEVSWLPVALTPGKVISPVPSKATPPMLRAFASDVAVPALPVVS